VGSVDENTTHFVDTTVNPNNTNTYLVVSVLGNTEYGSIETVVPPTTIFSMHWNHSILDHTIPYNTTFRYNFNLTSQNPISTWWVNNPAHFTITTNGVLTNATTLPAQTYVLTVFVNDTSGNVLTAPFQLDVQDNSSPVWTELPQDQEIPYGTPFRYNVNASDPSGIDIWSINSSFFNITQLGVITNATILPIGSYSIQISVNDTHGNTLTTTITIDVIPPQIPINYILILILGAGGFIAIVIIIFLKRKTP
jgi:hypothetical protein